MRDLIAPDRYRPPIHGTIAIAFNKKRSKILQEAKQTILNMYVHAYAMKIQEYERQYRQELSRFQQEVTNDGHKNETCSQSAITVYMKQRTNRIKQEIFHKISSFRKQLLRHRQGSSASTKSTIDVCPQVILDVGHVPLTATQLKYLSRGTPVFSTME